LTGEVYSTLYKICNDFPQKAVEHARLRGRLVLTVNVLASSAGSIATGRGQCDFCFDLLFSFSYNYWWIRYFFVIGSFRFR